MALSSEFSKNLINCRLDELQEYWQYLTHFHKEPSNKFALFCDYRSGSTLLSDLLNQHPEISCDGEIFLPFIKSKYYRILWPYTYLQGKSSRSTTSVYGFDCKIDQIIHGIHGSDSEVKFLEKLRLNNWKIIYLKRINIVRKSLSNYLANERHQWHRYSQEPYQNKKITIDLEKYAKVLNYHEKMSNKMEKAITRSSASYLTIIYEKDLLSSECHNQTVRKVCDYLNLPHQYAPSSMKQVSAKRLEDDIHNPEAFVEFLSSNGYGKYLDF